MTAILERINKVSWCVAENGLLLLLSANTHEIKLWTIAGTGNTFHGTCQKVYAHEDNNIDINSISNNSDGQTFISADEYEINLWNLDVTDSSFNLVEMQSSETSGYDLTVSP